MITTVKPTLNPTLASSKSPSSEPSVKPTRTASLVPSKVPSLKLSVEPSVEPSWAPSSSPSRKPSVDPSFSLYKQWSAQHPNQHPNYLQGMEYQLLPPQLPLQSQFRLVLDSVQVFPLHTHVFHQVSPQKWRFRRVNRSCFSLYHPPTYLAYIARERGISDNLAEHRRINLYRLLDNEQKRIKK